MTLPANIAKKTIMGTDFNAVGQGMILCPTQIIAETAQKRVVFISIEEILLSFTCSYNINYVSLPAY